MVSSYLMTVGYCKLNSNLFTDGKTKHSCEIWIIICISVYAVWFSLQKDLPIETAYWKQIVEGLPGFGIIIAKIEFFDRFVLDCWVLKE